MIRLISRVRPLGFSQGTTAAILMAGFGLALGARVVLGSPGVAQSAPAGLLFAGCLLLLTVAAGSRARITRHSIVIGLAGGLFLCIPALIARLFGAGAHVPAGNYLIWGLVVSIVAFAEEAFLRGALYEAISSWKGELAAVIATAVVFALLHGPLYGLRVVPLDLAVGLWLGALRVRSGSFMAPGIAHTVADLAGWFLR